MAFSSGSSQGSDPAPLAEINIIPLVDVMLVMLIIAMVTAPFMEQGLNVDLPVAKEAGNLEKGVTKEDPVFLYISQKDGLMLGKDRIQRADLSSHLANVFRDRTQREIFVKADRAIPYGDVAEIMAKVQAAGIAKVGLVTISE